MPDPHRCPHCKEPLAIRRWPGLERRHCPKGCYTLMVGSDHSSGPRARGALRQLDVRTKARNG